MTRHDQVPLMQQPGYVYRARKYVRMSEVEYGAATPETIAADRFGVYQRYRVAQRYRWEEWEATLLRGVVKRLGLRLYGWGRQRASGAETYHLTVNDREVEIRSYTDGRIMLRLDGQLVFCERTKWLTRGGVKHKVVEPQRVGQDHEDWELQKLHAEALIENVRYELDARRQKINSSKE